MIRNYVGIRGREKTTSNIRSPGFQILLYSGDLGIFITFHALLHLRLYEYCIMQFVAFWNIFRSPGISENKETSSLPVQMPSHQSHSVP